MLTLSTTSTVDRTGCAGTVERAGIPRPRRALNRARTGFAGPGLRAGCSKRTFEPGPGGERRAPAMRGADPRTPGEGQRTVTLSTSMVMPLTCGVDVAVVTVPVPRPTPLTLSV
ncbi:hypothetical protein GCM10017673_00080 [Streptosporangium violaceochromogenes]|nr:hypothetical protein GCM10017673_00080 [Streptosporangium violaceochromogenes]